MTQLIFKKIHHSTFEYFIVENCLLVQFPITTVETHHYLRNGSVKVLHTSHKSRLAFLKLIFTLFSFRITSTILQSPVKMSIFTVVYDKFPICDVA